MARGGILGGMSEDPDKGKPYRHTRNKIQLMLTTMAKQTDPCSHNEDYSQMLEVIWLLADKYPVDVLDALIKVDSGWEE